MTARLAVGIGCRSDATAAEIAALVERALQGLNRDGARLFTLAQKAEAANIRAAARLLSLPLVGISGPDLAAVADRVTIRSPRVAIAVGVPSVAEAAALAGGGPGARLLVSRIVEGGVTCAVAIGAAR